jgi:hypothetical protein
MIASLLYSDEGSHTHIPTILYALLTTLFPNKVITNVYISVLYIIQLLIVYRLFFLVDSAAET